MEKTSPYRGVMWQEKTKRWTGWVGKRNVPVWGKDAYEAAILRDLCLLDYPQFLQKKLGLNFPWDVALKKHWRALYPPAAYRRFRGKFQVLPWVVPKDRSMGGNWDRSTVTEVSPKVPRHMGDKIYYLPAQKRWGFSFRFHFADRHQTPCKFTTTAWTEEEIVIKRDLYLILSEMSRDTINYKLNLLTTQAAFEQALDKRRHSKFIKTLMTKMAYLEW